ncbi:MAG: hypothetical protein ACK5KO_01290 [Arachnia sp.]
MSEAAFTSGEASTALRATRWRLIVYLAVATVASGIAGLVWAVGATRPGYVVNENLTASLPEAGLADVIASDALFSVLVSIFGLGLGLLAWVWFRDLGWWVLLVSIVASGLGGLLTWRLGLAIGESGFAERLATAQPGDIVPIDLELHTVSALLVAPFWAVTPIMLLAAFWPESRSDPDPEAPALAQ